MVKTAPHPQESLGEGNLDQAGEQSHPADKRQASGRRGDGRRHKDSCVATDDAEARTDAFETLQGSRYRKDNEREGNHRCDCLGLGSG